VWNKEGEVKVGDWGGRIRGGGVGARREGG